MKPWEEHIKADGGEPMSSRVGDPVPRRPQGALASQHGHTQLPGPQGGPQQVNPAMAASECTPHLPCKRPRGPLTVFPRPWLWGGCQGGCRPRWLSGPAPWQGAVGTSEPHRLLGLANRVVPICSSATWCPPAPAKPQEPALTLHTQVPSLRMSPAPEVTNKT